MPRINIQTSEETENKFWKVKCKEKQLYKQSNNIFNNNGEEKLL